MVTPRLRYATSRIRSVTSSYLNSSLPNTLSSGLKVTVVPFSLVLPTRVSGVLTTPLLILPPTCGDHGTPRDRDVPSLFTSTVSHSESAFVTDAPTPCRPPRVGVLPVVELRPPHGSWVNTTSTPLILSLGCLSTGIPRPLSLTRAMLPSRSSMVTVSPKPLATSSTQLSMISHKM